VFVAARGWHTVALAEGGVLWVWGWGDCGQLGLGDRDDGLVPTRLGAGEVFGGSLVRMAASGGDHTLVVTEEGVVWAIGGGEHGRLRLNDEDDRLVPTRVEAGADARGSAALRRRPGRHRRRRCLLLGRGDGGRRPLPWGKGEADSNDAGSQVPGGLGHADLRDRLVPTLVSPRLLGGARVGRWHGLMEGTHAGELVLQLIGKRRRRGGT
jgi:hypothetical protein